MFLTAGHLAEKLTGKSWEELVRERIFTPLGMTRSTFSVLDSEQSDDYSLPYRETEEKTIERIPFRRIDLIGPAGSINSSLEDMCAWVACNLAGGKYRGKEIIKTATLKDIHTPHMTMGQPAQRRELSPPSYGLGWMIDTYRGHLRVHHGGGIDGFITEVSLFPQDDLGMVLFVNRTAGVPELLSRHLADRLFGLEPIDWLAEGRSGSEEIQKKVEEGKKEKAKRFRLPGTTPSHALADYAGTYEDPGYGRLTVTLEAGTLSGAINGIDFPLEHWHYEVFHGGKGGPTGQDSTFEDLLFLFEADTKGNVAAVSVQLEPSVDSIEFAKTSNPMLSDPAFLARLEGTYNLAGQTINVVLQGDHLVASVPMTAQPTYKLVPGLGTEFKLEGVPGVALTFDVPGTGPAIAIVLEQPGATLVAERSEEKVPAGS
jgi:hypothetical protein